MHALQLKSSHSSWSHQNMVTSLACWGPAWLTTACSSSFYRSLPSCTFLIGHRTPCTLRRPSKDDLFMQNKTCNYCHHLVLQSETHFHYFFLMLLLKQIDLLIYTSFCVWLNYHFLILASIMHFLEGGIDMQYTYSWSAQWGSPHAPSAPWDVRPVPWQTKHTSV